MTYWDVVAVPTGDDPLDALIVRLAAAYREPWPLKFQLDDVGSAAGRAAALADPAGRVGTRDEMLTAGDHLGAYVLEGTLHHLDLVAHLPDVPGPARRGGWPGRGRCWSGSPRWRSRPRSATTPTGAERAAPGRTAARLPFPVG